jgi:PAS domain S-box-containing protein
MDTPLRVLLVEDSEADARLIVLELQQSGYDPKVERFYTPETFRAALTGKPWDIVIADYFMPRFDGLDALAMVKESGLDLPFIIVSGVIGEDVAVAAMKSGAHDYVMKDRLTRLGPAVQRALQEAEGRRAREWAEEAVRRRAGELNALQATVLDITTPHDLPTLLQTIVERAARLLNALGGGMYLCDPDRQEVRCVVSYNTPRDYTGTVLKYGEGAAGTVAQIGEPLIVDDYRVWPGRAAAYEEEQPFTAVLSAPMIWQGQVTGVIHVLHDVESRRFTEAGLQLLTLFANHAAIAVENARLHEQAQKEIAERKRMEEALRQRNRELALINRVSQALSSTLDPDQVLIVAMEEVCQILGVTATSIWLVDSETGELVCRQAIGPESSKVRGWRLLPEEGIVGWAARHGQSLIVPDARTDARHCREVDQRTGLGLCSIVSIPLKIKRNVIGVLQVVDTEVGRFSERDLALLEPLAASVAIAFENARLYEQAQQEIAERERAEAALRESEAHLWDLYENAPSAYFSVGADGLIRRCNKRARELLGYSTEELVGKPVFDLYADTPQGKGKASRIFERFIEGERVVGEELQMQKADGTLMWASLTVNAVRDADGKIVESRSMVEDITGRKQAEEAIVRAKEEWERTFDAVSDPIMVLDQEYRIVRANKAMADKFGITPLEAVGLICYQNVHGTQEPPAHCPHTRLMADDQEHTAEIHEERLGGDFLISVSPIHDADGRLIGSVHVSHDITERKRVEEALRQYAAELEARNEELDAFAHTVAHDLQNPLSLIIGYATVLEEDYAAMPEEKLQGSLQTVARAALRVSRIVDELLLLAGLRQMEVEIEPLDMASIVAEAQQRLAGMIKEHQAEVILPEVWPAALGYGPWIEEVWANYLSNAIKYGSRPPRVELGAMVQPGGAVRFWVRDDGPGLTPEEQSRLFTPFTRLDQARARGYGLGLSIVRRIMEKLGGQVGVESEGGKGSVFTFTLPGGG